MNHELLQGKYVRLTAENPEVNASAEARWWQDSEYFRLLDSESPHLWSEKKLKEWFEKGLEKEDPHSFGFSIRTVEGDKVIGFVALFALSWKDGDTLAAIAIGEREYWGKGFGTEAMNLLLGYTFRELNLRRVGLIVFEYNLRAIRSYEKVGFIHEGRIRGAMLREGKRWDWLMMGLLREEWEARQKEVV